MTVAMALCAASLSCGGSSTNSAATAPAKPAPVEGPSAYLAAEDNLPTATECGAGQHYDDEAGCVYMGSGPVVQLVYHNKMGSAFRPIGAAFGIDNTLVFDSNDSELLKERLPILTARWSRRRVVKTLLRYRGEGHGVFAYLRAYRFKITSRCELPPPRGHSEVLVEGYEKGSITTDISERPDVRWTARSGEQPWRCLD